MSKLIYPYVAVPTYQVSLPENFNFSQPQEWPRLIRCFEQFRKSARLAEKDDEVQVNTLIYSMSDEADDILRSFKLKDDEVKKYSVVKAKFEAHFVKRRNVIYDSIGENRRKESLWTFYH